jgi:hypothetical protein
MDFPNILTKGVSTSLDKTPIEDGKLRYCTDNGKVYLDQGVPGNGKRIALSDIIEGFTEAQIKANNYPLVKLYQASDTKHLFVYLNTIGWYDLTSITLKANTEDTDHVIWFGNSTDSDLSDSPKYNDDLKYNPAKKTLYSSVVKTQTMEVGELKITTTTNSDGSVEVDFSF